MRASTCPGDKFLPYFVQAELYLSTANEHNIAYVFIIVLLSFPEIWLFKLLPIIGYVFKDCTQCFKKWSLVLMHSQNLR